MSAATNVSNEDQNAASAFFLDVGGIEIKNWAALYGPNKNFFSMGHEQLVRMGSTQHLSLLGEEGSGSAHPKRAQQAAVCQLRNFLL